MLEIKTLKAVAMLVCLILSGPTLFAQWEEDEQAYVRASAESQPLESISIFVNERLKRTYKYDFYKRYLGYESASPSGKMLPALTRTYDEYGFLSQEMEGYENSSNTKTTTFSYNPLEAWEQQEICTRFELTDSISKLPTGAFKYRCNTQKIVFNEYHQPLETFTFYKEVYWLKEKNFYEDNRLVKTEFYHVGGDKPEMRYFALFEYDKSGHKTAVYLQCGNVKKLKESLTYDAEGRLATVKKYAVQYAPPREKIDNKMVITGESTILGDEKVLVELRFKYDKKGRVTVLESYFSDKLGQTLNFKYKSPKK